MGECFTKSWLTLGVEVPPGSAGDKMSKQQILEDKAIAKRELLRLSLLRKCASLQGPVLVSFRDESTDSSWEHSIFSNLHLKTEISKFSSGFGIHTSLYVKLVSLDQIKLPLSKKDFYVFLLKMGLEIPRACMNRQLFHTT